MKFKFWGVRGSIPTPGPNTVKYGGNTTCIEVKPSSGELLILDAGTGIHALAQSLSKQAPVTAHILLTHTHWDHIQGLPFFLPIFRRGSQIHIYGADDERTGRGIDRAMRVQLQHSYFPINEEQLKAEIVYHRLQPGQSIVIGNSTITPLMLNHPVVNLGYRIKDSDGSSLFFTGDYEPVFAASAQGTAGCVEAAQQIEQEQMGITRLLADVDALIVDASYTDAEYQDKVGWGHGTFEGGVRLAQKVRARQLFFTHHEPTRSDHELEVIYQMVLRAYDSVCMMHLAQEGAEFDATAL